MAPMLSFSQAKLKKNHIKLSTTPAFMIPVVFLLVTLCIDVIRTEIFLNFSTVVRIFVNVFFLLFAKNR